MRHASCSNLLFFSCVWLCYLEQGPPNSEAIVQKFGEETILQQYKNSFHFGIGFAGLNHASVKLVMNSQSLNIPFFLT
jgi:hypothetical protein